MFRTASENLVLETKQLPLLERLVQNIECLVAQLVAAGGLLSLIMSPWKANVVGGCAAGYCIVERGKGPQTPPPFPAPPSPLLMRN